PGLVARPDPSGVAVPRARGAADRRRRIPRADPRAAHRRARAVPRQHDPGLSGGPGDELRGASRRRRRRRRARRRAAARRDDAGARRRGMPGTPAEYLLGCAILAVVVGASAVVATLVIRRRLPALTGAMRVTAWALVFTLALIGVHLVPAVLAVLS